MPDDNSSMRRSPTSNDYLRLICRETCLFASLKIDRVLELAPVGHQLLPFKLFGKFPIERLQMEILSHQIHVGNNLWMLKSNAFGRCVLQGFIHQGQNGLLRSQGHPRPDQSFCFRALSSSAEAVTAAAAKWILGIKSEFARPAPVTVDTFHIHLTRALPGLITAGAFLSLWITGGSICPRQEAVTETAVRVVPVTSIALCALCTGEFWMTVTLAGIYVALEIQGPHCAAVTSLTASDDAVAPGVGCTFRTFLSNGIGRANASTSYWVTIITQVGTVAGYAASFLEVEISMGTAVTFLPCDSRLAPTLSTLFTVK